MRQLAFMLMGILLLFSNLYAQRTITGKVTDVNLKPLPFATIKIKGTSFGAATDQQGNFKLPLTGTAKSIIITAVGMEETEVQLTNSNFYEIKLATEDKALEEVVVVGYGSAKKKENVATYQFFVR